MNMENPQNYFEKKFKFSNNGFQVSSKVFEASKWADEVLQVQKMKLNDVKTTLNNMDNKRWREHTYVTHRGGNIVPFVRRTYNINIATQAWCKFFEILNSFNLITKNVLRSFHVCEAPGTFINALDVFTKYKMKTEKWTWNANTLNPLYEGHSDSRAIFTDTFILKTLNNWFFGLKNDGDITDPEYLKELVEFLSKDEEPITLVTADGSIDCKEYPEEQELTTHYLHFSEVCVALHILSSSGHLVVKMFTFFECDTICMIYLLVCSFDEVHVYKPATSKAGNSEVYLICKGYNKDRILHLLPFLKPTQSSNRALFSKDTIPDSFLSQIRECSQLFNDYQKASILENIELYNNFELTQKCLLNCLKDECTKLYVEKCFEGVPEYERENGKRKENSEWDRLVPRGKVCQGSYNDRLRNRYNSPEEQLQFLKKEFNANIHGITLRKIEPLIIAELEHGIDQPNNEWITFGKGFSKIESSKFCNDDVLAVKIKIPSSKITKKETQLMDLPWINTRIQQMGNIYLLSKLIYYTPKGVENHDLVLETKGDSFVKAENKFYLVNFLLQDEISNDTKTFLFSALNDVLKVLLKGDYLELYVPSLLTRVFVGAVYLVALNFEKITTELDNEGTFQIWSFHQFIGKSQPAQNHFQHLLTLEPPVGLTVLEIVPTLTLTTCFKFYKLVSNMNTLQISRHLKIMFKTHKKRPKKKSQHSKSIDQETQ